MPSPWPFFASHSLVRRTPSSMLLTLFRLSEPLSLPLQLFTYGASPTNASGHVAVSSDRSGGC